MEFLATLISLAHAEILTELPATPNVMSEPAAKLLIQEVNFKNPDADWVSLIYESPSGKPVNLKSISFEDDKTIKLIEEDFIIASGQEVLLTFKSDEEDTTPYLYSDRSGLTGTTEQFIIRDSDGSVADAVCWTSDKPTVSEIEEMEELFNDGGWHSEDVTSCVPSGDVEKYKSIIRVGLNDTNSAADWEIEGIETLPPEEIEEVELQTIVKPHFPAIEEITPAEDPLPDKPMEILESPDLVAVNKPIPPPVEEKVKSKSSDKPIYSNGNLSDTIVVSEIMPNPDGSDSNKEWVELTNTGDTAVNLGNWQLDDIEEGSKPYVLPDSLNIEAGSAVIIESSSSKLSLGNSEDAVRLFDYSDTLVFEISYESAPSGESFSRITLEKENGDEESEWIWTAETSPGSINPSYIELSGKIIEEPIFADTYSFKIETADAKIKTVLFDEAVIPAPLAKASLIKNSTGSFVLLPIASETYQLFKYRLDETNEQSDNSIPLIIPSVIAVLILAGTGGYFGLKKMKWYKQSKEV